MFLSVGIYVSEAGANRPASASTTSSFTGSISNGYGFCLGVDLVTYAVVNVKCNTQSTLSSTKSSRSAGYNLQINGACLTASALKDGQDLSISACGSGSATQQDWVGLPNGGIGLVDTNFCLDVETGIPKLRSPIQIYTCQGLNSGNVRIPAQRWKYDQSVFQQKGAAQTTPGATYVSDEGALRQVMFTSNTAIQKSNDWRTEEPLYGSKETSLASWDACSKSFGGPTGAKNVNWVINLPSGIHQRNSGKGIMFRVSGIDGKFLPHATLQTTYEGACGRYVADSKGWVVIPNSREMLLMYGNTVNEWPKNPILEVALLTLNGRGPIEIVKLTNPRNKRSGACVWVKRIGYTKVALKTTISVIGVFSPGFGGVVATATSITLGMIDKPNNPEPTTVDVILTFASSVEATRAMAELAKLKNLELTKAITKTQFRVIFKPVSATFGAFSLLSTGVSTYVGVQSVNKDYKNSCG